jgi:hypothetical protein
MLEIYEGAPDRSDVRGTGIEWDIPAMVHPGGIDLLG